MFLRTPTVARDRKTLLIYVVAEFWTTQAQFDGGQQPTVINDFLMQIAPSITAIRVVGGRWVRLDGVRVRPEDVTPADDAIGWQYTTTTKTQPEVLAEMEANILNFWRRAKANGWTGDRRTFHELSEADPDGVLSIAKQWSGRIQDYPGL